MVRRLLEEACGGGGLPSFDLPPSKYPVADHWTLICVKKTYFITPISSGEGMAPKQNRSFSDGRHGASNDQNYGLMMVYVIYGAGPVLHGKFPALIPAYFDDGGVTTGLGGPGRS